MDKYRYDVNFLRAIAVVSVVIFHYFPYLLPGGFAGVDVFFVISGYLMTSIVASRLENGTFRLSDFYMARFRRIVPALAFLCIAMYMVAVMLIAPYDQIKIFKHILSSITFTSNIIYWFEDGYFDVASTQKWLLHTWSLSVEWQFYLVFPLVMMAGWKLFGRKTLLSIFALSTVLLLAFTIYAARNWVSASYFLLPTRAWELLAGGLAYFYSLNISKNRATIYQLIGLLVVLLSFFIVKESHFWPAEYAVVPVGGALFVLLVNYQSGRWLRSKAFKWIGERSYSIYLWHWPLYVFSGYFFNHSLLSQIIALFVTLVLSDFSFKYVENIFRIRTRRRISTVVVTCVFVVLLTGVGVNRTAYIHGNSLETVEQIKQDRNYPDVASFEGLTVRQLGNNNHKSVLFVGDSVVEHLSPSVKFLLSDNQDKGAWFLTSGGCVPMPEIVRSKWDCSNVEGFGLLLNQQFQKVVIGGLWPAYLYSEKSSEMFAQAENGERVSIKSHEGRELFYQAFENLVKRIKETGADVYFILDHPWGEEFDPVSIHRKCSRGFSECNFPLTVSKTTQELRYKEYRSTIGEIATKHGITLIDPLKELCDDECFITDVSGSPLYQDAIHFRSSYSSTRLTFLSNLFE